MARTAQQIRLLQAECSLNGCIAHYHGMKLRARLNPPTAAVGGFPYPARTCDQWAVGQEQRFWSDAELRTAFRLRSIGWTRDEIAAEIGRTPKALKHMFERQRGYPLRTTSVPVWHGTRSR